MLSNVTPLGSCMLHYVMASLHICIYIVNFRRITQCYRVSFKMFKNPVGWKYAISLFASADYAVFCCFVLVFI